MQFGRTMPCRRAWLLFALCSHGAAGEDVPDGLYAADSPVTTFTDKMLPGWGDNADGRFVLVEYYSAWCGHCQRFKPEYEETARKAKVALPSLIVGAVNCPTYSDACAEAKVSSFPTIIIYTGSGPKHEYKGSRKPDDIITWAMQFTPTAASDAHVHAAAHVAKVASDAGAHPHANRSVSLATLRPRQIPLPVSGSLFARHARVSATPHLCHRDPVQVPTQDVIAAARQSLIEVANARLAATKQANSELANAESHKDSLGARSEPESPPLGPPARTVRLVATHYRGTLASSSPTAHEHDPRARPTSASHECDPRPMSSSCRFAGALLGWLRVLHHQLPREWDGGAAAASAAELQVVRTVACA